jgi:hypothetical protein
LTGVIPRVLRGGNPLETLDPFASSTYGTAAKNVVLDPDEPGQANGVKLFSVTF